MINNLGIIIVAGGSGSRFGNDNKLLAKIDDKPVLLHTLSNFIKMCPTNHFILVSSSKFIDECKALLRCNLKDKEISIIKGGATRSKSVQNGLAALPDSATIVAIHDAARPLASSKLLSRCMEYFKKNGSCVAAKKVVNTIKEASSDGFVKKTLDRNKLWSIETPQIFYTEELKEAYLKTEVDNYNSTDDASVMEYIGKPVFLFENPSPNIKITYEEDIHYAEAVLKNQHNKE